MNATCRLDGSKATIVNNGRATSYTIELLTTGDNTRRVLDIADQYGAVGPRGAWYMLQTFNDGMFRLLPMRGMSANRTITGMVAR